MILQNQVRCLKCGGEPYSAYRHDFRCCSCGSIAVDGGLSYLRRVGDIDNTVDMSIVIDDYVYSAIAKALQWSEETGRNELGTICAIMRVLRDSGYNLNKENKEVEISYDF